MKYKMFTLVTGLLSIFSISSEVAAQKYGGCPAFNSAMVDSTFMAINYSPSPFRDPEVYVVDNPEAPELWCTITDPEDSRGEQFFVRVVGEEFEGEGGVAHLFGRSDHYGDTLLRTRLADLTEQEMQACSSEVKKSFVWNRYCSPSESSSDEENGNNAAIVFSGDECQTVIDHDLMDLGISIGELESERVHIVGRYAGGSFPHSSAKAMCNGTHSLDLPIPQSLRGRPCMIEGIPSITEESVIVLSPGGHWSLTCTWPRS